MTSTEVLATVIGFEDCAVEQSYPYRIGDVRLSPLRQAAPFPFAPGIPSRKATSGLSAIPA